MSKTAQHYFQTLAYYQRTSDRSAIAILRYIAARLVSA